MKPVKSSRRSKEHERLRNYTADELYDSYQSPATMLMNSTTPKIGNILANTENSISTREGDETQHTLDERQFISNFRKARNSTPTPLIDAKVIKQRDMPTSLFADFIESGTTGDIDIFLTRVS